jgi:hypothetical protein
METRVGRLASASARAWVTSGCHQLGIPGGDGEPMAEAEGAMSRKSTPRIPSATDEECAEFHRRTGGLTHPSSKWCGLITAARCGLDGGECDGWCRSAREAESQPERTDDDE